MKTEIADSDLISARKAAIAFQGDAERNFKCFEIEWERAENLKIRLQKAKYNYPIFLVIGIMIGVLSVLIVASL